jgi:phosphate transporter
LVDDFGERYLTVGSFILGGVPSSIFAYLVVVTVGYVLMRILGL